jgi:hypothetical protein
MKYDAKTPDAYIAQLPVDRQHAFSTLREVIRENLPEGFEETMTYGMISYVVPHSIYPAGYHVNPEIPLPFISLGSQKHFIALYHMGMYTNEDLEKWFVAEYPKHSKTKLDMGKSCIRLKKMDAIPYALIAELVRKMTVDDWISAYEKSKQGK